jgi:hypothetical protein
MIEETTFNAFSDELKKIAGLADIAKGVGRWAKTAPKWIQTGWEKPVGLYEKATHEVPQMVAGKNVMKKVPLKNEAGEQVWHNRPDATWMGRGNGPQDAPWKDRTGVTKYLPVGDKAIYTGLTAAALPGAMKKEDPQGAGRSRAERVSGLAGSTLGALAGMGAAAHLPMKGLGITRSIIGGLGGSLLGERMATSPFRHSRKAEMPAVAPQQVAPPPVGGAV